MKATSHILRKELKQALFRKESYSYWDHFFEDQQTGKKLRSSKLDELNVQQIYNQYRSKHHIPFPEEIKAIRTQYGLSASKMSEVLDFGINSYRQYEQGDVPSLANAKLIRVASKASQFEHFIYEKRDLFSPAAFLKAMEKIQVLKAQENDSCRESLLWGQDKRSNEYTGFRAPDFKKLASFVLFFAKENQPLKTRLNKLLFYADFLFYQTYGKSISACPYRAIQLGPVPAFFRELYGILEKEGIIKIEEELYDHGGVGERFIANSELDESMFSEEELKVMRMVVKTFEETRTRKIIEISHKEKGWLENQVNKRLISYQAYAFDLQGA